MLLRLFFILLLLSASPCALAAELPGIPQFIDEMVAKHQFKRDELARIFQHAQHRQTVLDAISVPISAKPWMEYRAIFVNNQRIKGGLKFWKSHAKSLRRAEEQYGVPQEIIVALIGVETLYGKNAGKFNTLDALTTLAFDFPRRADFFRSELEQYLLLAREQKLSLFKVQGSYAGALGIPQFMPGSYRKFAVDFDRDGRKDLLKSPVDAIGSVANYLKQYGWLSGEPITVRASVSTDTCVGSMADSRTIAEWERVGVKQDNKEIWGGKPARLMAFTVADGKEFWLGFNNFEVITRYNNSDFYAMTVVQLAEALREEKEKGDSR